MVWSPVAEHVFHFDVVSAVPLLAPFDPGGAVFRNVLADEGSRDDLPVRRPTVWAAALPPFAALDVSADVKVFRRPRAEGHVGRRRGVRIPMAAPPYALATVARVLDIE